MFPPEACTWATSEIAAALGALAGLVRTPAIVVPPHGTAPSPPRPGAELSDDAAAARVSQGDRLCHQRRFGDAAAACRAAIALDPSSVRAHAGLGYAQYRRSQLADAEAACRDAIRLDPAYASRIRISCRCYSSRGKGVRQGKSERRLPK